MKRRTAGDVERVRVEFRLKKDLVEQIDAALFDTFRNKREYGTRNVLVEQLLEVYLKKHCENKGITVEILLDTYNKMKGGN